MLQAAEGMRVAPSLALSCSSTCVTECLLSQPSLTPLSRLALLAGSDRHSLSLCLSPGMAGAEVEEMVFLYCTCSQQELYKEVRRLSKLIGHGTDVGHGTDALSAGLYASSPPAPASYPLPRFAVLDMPAPVARPTEGSAGWHLTRSRLAGL